MTEEAGTVRAAWNHRHRLRQSATEARRGVFNPHHSVRAFRVVGHIDLAALERAWLDLQRRHPVLLTAFGSEHEQDGDRWRLTGADPAGPTRLTAAAEQADEALRGAAAEPFDVANGPLGRLIVVELDGPGQETLVAVVVEHLITDGWSGTVLLRDLRTLYAAEVGAPHEALPVIEQDFVTFTARQNDYLESAAGWRQRRRLAESAVAGGPLPNLALKGFTGDVPVRHERNRWLDRTLDAATYDRLLPVARATRTTRLNLVLVAVHTALADLSDKRVIATTVTVANRAHPSLRHSVGWFAGKVVVTSEPHAHAEPLHRIDALRAAVAAGLDASRVPWPTQIHDHRPERFGTQASEPFLSFNAQPERMGDSGAFGELLVGTSARPVPLRLGWQDAALATQWQECGPGGLRLTVNYKTDWYAETDVAQLWDTVVDHLELLAHLPVTEKASRP